MMHEVEAFCPPPLLCPVGDLLLLLLLMPLFLLWYFFLLHLLLWLLLPLWPLMWWWLLLWLRYVLFYRKQHVCHFPTPLTSFQAPSGVFTDTPSSVAIVGAGWGEDCVHLMGALLSYVPWSSTQPTTRSGPPPTSSFHGKPIYLEFLQNFFSLLATPCHR